VIQFAALHDGGDEQGQDEEGTEEAQQRYEQACHDQRHAHGHQLAAPLAGCPAEDVHVVRGGAGTGDVHGCVVRRHHRAVVGGATPGGGALRGGTSPRGVQRGGRDDLRQTVVVRRAVAAQSADQFPAGDERDQTADHCGHEPGPDSGLVLEESEVEGHDECAEAECGEQTEDDDLLDCDASLGWELGHPARTFFRSSLLPSR
jgi:hypothetical protein